MSDALQQLRDAVTEAVIGLPPLPEGLQWEFDGFTDPDGSNMVHLTFKAVPAPPSEMTYGDGHAAGDPHRP